MTITSTTNEQQQKFIDFDLHKHNYSLLGIPGGGKTYSIVQAIKRIPHKALVLTFSRAACETIHSRSNAYAKTIHSLSSQINAAYKNGVNITIQPVQATINMKRAESRASFLSKVPQLSQIEYILVDEAQDLSDIQYDFCNTLRTLLRIPLTLVGDPNQNIYQFQGGNDKYLVSHATPDKEVVLVQNYRSTPQIVEFCNQLRPWGDRYPPMISAVKHNGPKPYIYRSNKSYKDGFEDVIHHVCYTISQKIPIGEWEDTVILAPAKKTSNRIGSYYKLALTMFTQNMDYQGVKFKCQFKHAIDSDSVFSNEPFKTEYGKVNLMTCHASKGLEFKHVFLLNFNNAAMGRLPDRDQYSRFQYLFYVACTRAKYRLNIYINHYCPLYWFKKKDRNDKAVKVVKDDDDSNGNNDNNDNSNSNTTNNDNNTDNNTNDNNTTNDIQQGINPAYSMLKNVSHESYNCNIPKNQLSKYFMNIKDDTIYRNVFGVGELVKPCDDVITTTNMYNVYSSIPTYMYKGTYKVPSAVTVQDVQEYQEYPDLHGVIAEELFKYLFKCRRGRLTEYKASIKQKLKETVLVPTEYADEYNEMKEAIPVMFNGITYELLLSMRDKVTSKYSGLYNWTIEYVEKHKLKRIWLLMESEYMQKAKEKIYKLVNVIKHENEYNDMENDDVDNVVDVEYIENHHLNNVDYCGNADSENGNTNNVDADSKEHLNNSENARFNNMLKGCDVNGDNKKHDIGKDDIMQTKIDNDNCGEDNIVNDESNTKDNNNENNKSIVNDENNKSIVSDINENNTHNNNKNNPNNTNQNNKLQNSEYTSTNTYSVNKHYINIISHIQREFYRIKTQVTNNITNDELSHVIDNIFESLPIISDCVKYVSSRHEHVSFNVYKKHKYCDVQGELDIIADGSKVIELKYVSSVQDQHIHQTLWYHNLLHPLWSREVDENGKVVTQNSVPFVTIVNLRQGAIRTYSIGAYSKNTGIYDTKTSSVQIKEIQPVHSGIEFIQVYSKAMNEKYSKLEISEIKVVHHGGKYRELYTSTVVASVPPNAVVYSWEKVNSNDVYGRETHYIAELAKAKDANCNISSIVACAKYFGSKINKNGKVIVTLCGLVRKLCK